MEQDKPSPQEPIIAPLSSTRIPTTTAHGGQDLPAMASISDTEFPTAVYASVVLAFVWVLFASWLMFGSGSDIDLDLGIATVLFFMMLGLPIVLGKMAASHNRLPREELRQFLASDVEIATGRLSGSQVWVQVLLVPGALAFAATVIGAVKVIFG